MVAANGVYKIAVMGTVLGQQHIHTLHFRSTTDPDGLVMTEPAYMAALLALWQGAPRTAYRTMFHITESPTVQYQVRKVCGTEPLPAGLDIAGAGGTTAGTGSYGGDVAAPWLAQVTTLRSALAGRRFRGRYFVGGLNEENLVGAAITGQRNVNSQNYADALVAAFVTPAETAEIAKLFVFSRTQSEVPGTQCQNAGADVVSLQLRTTLATMKSRKAGSGI